MTVVKFVGANKQQPVKIQSVITQENAGKHFIIGPRELGSLRDRIIILLDVGALQLQMFFLDNGKKVDITQDIEVLEAKELQVTYWLK